MHLYKVMFLSIFLVLSGLKAFSAELAESVDEKAVVLTAEESTDIYNVDESNCAEVFGAPPSGYASCMDWVVDEAVEDVQANQ